MPSDFVTKSLRHFYTDSENHSQGACSLLGAVNAEFRRARGASPAGCGHIAAVLRLGCEVAWPAVLDGDGAPPTASTSGDTISIISRPCASAAVLARPTASTTTRSGHNMDTAGHKPPL